MKKIILSLALICLATSCKQKEKVANPEAYGISYVIQGEVQDGEGKRLALYIPGENLDNRQVTSITNGKFEFCGTVMKPENAFITFEEEHENEDGLMSIYELFLTGDTIKLRAQVVEKYESLFLDNDTILQSEINRYHQATGEKFREAYNGAMVFGDSTKNDSMRRNIYPEIRSRVLKAYQKYYSNPEYSVMNLSRLRQITDDNHLFNPEDLSSEEKKQLFSFFDNVDPVLEGTSNYTVVSSALGNLKNFGSRRGFLDFSLPDLEGNKQQLSEIIKQNEYTILDFWWAGCLPCRKFNRENRAKYVELKQKGIEVIAINVDMGEQQWQLASQKDEIEWVNLYAGAHSKIQADYNIKSFPTKIVVDRNLNIIEIDFKDLDELEKKLLTATPVGEGEL